MLDMLEERKRKFLLQLISLVGGCYFNMFIGFVCRQKLCINFYVSRANFLTTSHSHLDVSDYFWSNLFNVDVNFIYIYIVKLELLSKMY